MALARPIKRLVAAIALALSLAPATTALAGPSQTLAHTRRASCASARAKARCDARQCAQTAHKGRRRRAARCHSNRASARKAPKATSRRALTPAYCEGGGAPVQADDGSFSCEDGAEPQCENGAIPTPRGNSLVCPIVFSEESISSQAECEEEEREEGAGSSCAGASSGAGEPACEEPSGENAQCEAAG